jgi:hypothetical protein
MPTTFRPPVGISHMHLRSQTVGYPTCISFVGLWDIPLLFCLIVWDIPDTSYSHRIWAICCYTMWDIPHVYCSMFRGIFHTQLLSPHVGISHMHMRSWTVGYPRHCYSLLYGISHIPTPVELWDIPHVPGSTGSWDIPLICICLGLMGYPRYLFLQMMGYPMGPLFLW